MPDASATPAATSASDASAKTGAPAAPSISAAAATAAANAAVDTVKADVVQTAQTRPWKLVVICAAVGFVAGIIVSHFLPII